MSIDTHAAICYREDSRGAVALRPCKPPTFAPLLKSLPIVQYRGQFGIDLSQTNVYYRKRKDEKSMNDLNYEILTILTETEFSEEQLQRILEKATELSK